MAKLLRHSKPIQADEISAFMTQSLDTSTLGAWAKLVALLEQECAAMIVMANASSRVAGPGSGYPVAIWSGLRIRELGRQHPMELLISVGSAKTVVLWFRFMRVIPSGTGVTWPCYPSCTTDSRALPGGKHSVLAVLHSLRRWGHPRTWQFVHLLHIWVTGVITQKSKLCFL